MIDQQPAHHLRPSGNRTVRQAAIGGFLLLLVGAVNFAAESLEPERPIANLIMAVITGFCALTLAWIIVGVWWARHFDKTS